MFEQLQQLQANAEQIHAQYLAIEAEKDRLYEAIDVSDDPATVRALADQARALAARLRELMATAEQMTEALGSAYESIQSSLDAIHGAIEDRLSDVTVYGDPDDIEAAADDATQWAAENEGEQRSRVHLKRIFA